MMVFLHDSIFNKYIGGLVHDKRVPVATAWHILRLQMWIGVQSRGESNLSRGANLIQTLVLQVGGFA
jgi:hypothetical protein